MKTKLPKKIKTIEEAKAFLTELHDNGELYHPEDSAVYVLWSNCEHPPTHIEQKKLDQLMADIYNLPGNDGRHSAPMVFDPCAFLNELDGINKLDDKDVNIDDLINPDEDDRIFTADDMIQFAIKIASCAINNGFDYAAIASYAFEEAQYEEGDGSYETYKMPKR